MRKGWGVGQRYAEDPIGSDAPRGKNREERRHRNDPGLTPTEQHIKNRLMNQFRRTGEGPGGNSEAYRVSPAWCGCGRHFKAEGQWQCDRCLATYPEATITAEQYEASRARGDEFITPGWGE